jgi:imidazolonepropionase-like amidohydrolase
VDDENMGRSRHRTWAWLLLLVAGGCASRRPTAGLSHPRGGLWIRDVTLMSPERDQPLRHAHVLIRDGRINWVGSAPPGGDVAGATSIDGAGRYLVPGLIDGHVHLSEIPGLDRDRAAALPELVESYFRQLPRSYLYFGFTVVVDLNVIDRVRVDQVRSAPVGPAVFDCGSALVLANGYPMAYFPSPQRFALFPNFLYDPRQAGSIPSSYRPADHSPEAAVGRVAAAGGICVKSAFEPGFGPQRATLPTPTEPLMRQVLAASHERHLPLLLHANSLTAHRFAAAIPVDAVVHGLWNWEGAQSGTGLPIEVQRVLEDERKSGIAAMATLRVMGGLADLFSPEFLDDPHLARVLPARLSAWYRGDGRWFAADLRRDFAGLPDARIRQILDAGKEGAGAAIREFSARGGRLLFGSDTPSGPTYANPPGYNGYLELLALERAGIPPRQILAAATVTTARFFNLGADYGTIEPGKRASLLLLRADPERSVTAFDTIDLVIHNDRVLTRSELAATN